MRETYKVKCRQVLAIIMTVLMVVTSVNIVPVQTEAASKKAAKSISLNYSEYTLKKGKTLKLKATILPKNAKSKKVVWKSNKKSVATVNSKGVIKAVKKGKATITATVEGTKLKASCKISVGTPVSKVVVNTNAATLKVGETISAKPTIKPANATNKAVSYSSSNTAVATVSKNGDIAAIGVGKAVIIVKAKDGSGKKAKLDVAVENASTPEQPTTQPSTPEPTTSAPTKTEPTTTEVPTPEPPTPVKVNSVSVEPENAVLKVDDQLQLKATVLPENAEDKGVIYSSSNTNVVVVDRTTGLVKAVRNGEATVTVTAVDGGVKAECQIIVGVPVESITLSETEKTIQAGKTFQLTATSTPENATNTDFVWTSSDESIATVDNSGVVTTKKDGKVEITVSTSNQKVKASCAVNVATPVTGIMLDRDEKVISIDESVTLTATISPENAGNQEVVWTSSNESVATVDKGVVTGHAIGIAEITATTVDGNKKAICVVAVGNVEKAETFADLLTILEKTEGETYIICNTEETGTFEIPEGSYPNVQLFINAPNATITNNAVFKRVEIQSISSDTWIEKATGNQIDIIAKQAHVIVDGKDVAIKIQSGAEKVNIENNGLISGITIKAKAGIRISGTNHSIIPVEAKVEGAIITTAIPVAVDATRSFTLQLCPGAENSSIVIADEDVVPTIHGIGKVQVTNKETNEVKEQLAENVQFDNGLEDTETVKGVITGKVYGATKESLANAVVYVIPYTVSFDKSKLESAIEVAEQQEQCYVTTTGEDGVYTTAQIPYGNYVLIVKADGLQSVFQTLVLNSESYANEDIIMLEATEEKGNIEGTLYDAATAQTVPAGISLFIRQGANNDMGDFVAETQTDEKGKYVFSDLPAGTYTIQVVDNRQVEEPYVRTTFNVVVLANTTIKENMTITRQVDSDQVRFVLTWGAEEENIPSDLDSHLIGPGRYDSEKFHTYYIDKSYSEGNIKYADLDVDDTDYEGPETTTVYTAVNGVYHFYVYDYSNQEDENNTKLATSQAKVNVYVGDRNIATYYVPNAVGTLWDVCTYDIKKNILTPVNKVYYHPGDSENVGLEPIDIVRNRLSKLVEQGENVSFGAAVDAELSKKIQNARELLKSTEEYDTLNTLYNELQEIINGLLNSTAIDEITAEELKNYSLYRQGNYDEEGNLLKGYSIIKLRGYKETCMDNLQIRLNRESENYELKASDKEQYAKKLIVTDSETGAVENYYLYFEEYIPSLYPTDVTDGDNYILNCYTEYYWDEEDNEYPYVSITGEDETLSNPVFTFEESSIKASYEKTEEQIGYVGKLTVTYGSKTVVYPVKYKKEIHNIELKGIKDANNYLSELDWDWIYTEEEEYKVYEIEGLNDTLSSSAQFELDIESDNIEVASVEGKEWNYELIVTYKEQTQVIRLRYRKMERESFLPSSGSYNWRLEGSGDESFPSAQGYFNRIEMKDGNINLFVTLNPDGVRWDTINLWTWKDEISYEIQSDANQHTLVILFDEKEIASYPVELVYEPQPSKITDGDNRINSFSIYNGLTSESEESYQYILISGEDAELKNPVCTFMDDSAVSSKYEAKADGDFVGIMTITHQNGSKAYPVMYKQEIHKIELKSITEQGNYINGYIRKTTEYSDEDDEIYTIYNVEGINETLGEDAQYVFDTDVSNYTVKQVEGKKWNYEITLEYKGEMQVIYLEYKANMKLILPTYGSYKTKDEQTYIKSITNINFVNSAIQITVEDALKNVDYDTITLGTYAKDFSYKVNADENGYSVSVLYQESEIASYPLNLFYAPRPMDVKDEGNYILNLSVYNTYDASSSVRQYIYIEGENETLTAPEFTFKDPEVKAEYTASEDENYVGILRVQVEENIIEYPVKYVNKIHELSLKSIAEEGNVLSSVNYYWDYDTEDYTNNKVYKVEGMNEVLGEGAVFTFDSEVDKVTAQAVEDKKWNYEITVEYKGEKQTVYLKYINNVNFVLPNNGTYKTKDEETYTKYIKDIAFVDSMVQLSVRDDLKNVDYETISLRTNTNGFSYEINADGEGYSLTVLEQDREVACYPLVLIYSPEPTGVTEEGNYILDYFMTKGSTDGKPEEKYIYNIIGENDSLTNPVFKFENPEVTSEYTAIENDLYAGILHVKTGEGEIEYPVKYIKRVHELSLEGISEEGNTFGYIDWNSKYDEETKRYYKVYQITGSKDVLGEGVSFTFDSEVDNVTVQAVEDKAWNYEIIVSYKQEEQIFYLKYTTEGTTEEEESSGEEEPVTEEELSEEPADEEIK